MQVPEGAEGFEEHLREALKGFKELCLLKAALDTGIFGRLQSPLSLEGLAEELGFDRRLLFLFIENLVRIGLLQRDGGGYSLSPLGWALVTPGAPHCQLRRLRHEIERALRWLDLPQLLSGGGSRHERIPFFGEIVHVLAEQRLLGELREVLEVVRRLEGFKRARRCLDLGGGHGLFAIAFAMAKEDLEAYVFDLPRVLDETKGYIERFGAERVHLVAGDFFKDELGRDYDLVFSAYNPGGKRAELIPKIYRSLKEGGTYINLQFFPEPDSPFTLDDLEWNLWSFGLEKGPRAYTFDGDLDLKGYLGALEKEGFEVEEVLEMRRGDRMVVAIRPCRDGMSKD